jgi:hypothetical protein
MDSGHRATLVARAEAAAMMRPCAVRVEGSRAAAAAAAALEVRRGCRVRGERKRVDFGGCLRAAPKSPLEARGTREGEMEAVR